MTKILIKFIYNFDVNMITEYPVKFVDYSYTISRKNNLDLINMLGVN